jgi:hypothetical protein
MASSPALTTAPSSHWGGGERRFAWLFDGDTSSQFNPMLKMSAVIAAVFDEGVAWVGAAITGRRTYEVSEAWGGSGPMPGIPLFVVERRLGVGPGGGRTVPTVVAARIEQVREGSPVAVSWSTASRQT